MRLLRTSTFGRPSAPSPLPRLARRAWLALCALLALGGALRPTGAPAQSMAPAEVRALIDEQYRKSREFYALATAATDAADQRLYTLWGGYHLCQAKRLEPNSGIPYCPTPPELRMGATKLERDVSDAVAAGYVVQSVLSMFSQWEAGYQAKLLAARTEAASALEAQRWGQAEQAFAVALRMRPNEPPLHTGRAVALYKLGRADSAFMTLQRAAVHFELDKDGTTLAGVVIRQIARRPDAAANFDRLGRSAAGRLRNRFGGPVLGGVLLAVAGATVGGIRAANGSPLSPDATMREFDAHTAHIGRGIAVGALSAAVVGTLFTEAFGPEALTPGERRMVDAIPGAHRESYLQAYGEASRHARRTEWRVGLWVTGVGGAVMGLLLPSLPD